LGGITMIKKTMTCKDFNNEDAKETFRFNLTEAEVTEMDLSHEGGLEAMMKKLAVSKDVKVIMQIFKDIILLSYGEIAPNGRTFIKSEEMRTDFEQTQYYSDLFMELTFDAEKAAEFINGIAPAPRKITNTMPQKAIATK